MHITVIAIIRAVKAAIISGRPAEAYILENAVIVNQANADVSHAR
jgi:hypothetical protein